AAFEDVANQPPRGFRCQRLVHVTGYARVRLDYLSSYGLSAKLRPGPPQTPRRAPPRRYVFASTPPALLPFSTSLRPRGGTPFSNNRFPLPSTTGNVQMRCSSMSSAAISACSSSLLPQMCSAGPSEALSWRTPSIPPTRCDFSQPRRSSVLVTTYF